MTDQDHVVHIGFNVSLCGVSPLPVKFLRQNFLFSDDWFNNGRCALSACWKCESLLVVSAFMVIDIWVKDFVESILRLPISQCAMCTFHIVQYPYNIVRKQEINWHNDRNHLWQ